MQESEAKILQITERFGDSREGSQKYLEVRRRVREGEDTNGVTGNLLELAQASIRSVKWN